MAKKNLLIIDSDAHYLKQLENYLTSRHPDQFATIVFSSVESVLANIDSMPRKADILLISPELFSERLIKIADIVMLLVDKKAQPPIQGYALIHKFQDGENIVRNLLENYRSINPNEPAVQQINGNTQLITLFSPIGGSGKTTIALGLAAILGRGQRVLFLSLEQLQFTQQILSSDSNYNMSDLLNAESGADIKKMISHDEEKHVDFIKCPTCFADLNIIKEDKWLLFLKSMLSITLYDKIILDLSSYMDDKVLQILEISHKIVVPVLDSFMSMLKVNRFLHDLKQIHYDRLLSQCIFVLNQYNGLQPHQEIPVVQMLSYDPMVGQGPLAPETQAGSFWKDMQNLSRLFS